MFISGTGADQIEPFVPPWMGNLIAAIVFFVLALQTYSAEVPKIEKDEELGSIQSEIQPSNPGRSETMSLIVGLSFSNIAGGLAVGFAEKMNVSFVSFLVFIASFVLWLMGYYIGKFLRSRINLELINQFAAFSLAFVAILQLKDLFY